MILRRQKFESQQSLERYGWADSSPVAQADWIISKHQTVATSSCAELWLACCELCTLEVDTEDVAEQQRRIELTKSLLAGISVQTQPPQTLAMGLTHIESKLSALAFSFFLEVGSLTGLKILLDSFVSFTTDAGTEFGTASFMIDDLRKLLPEWLVQRVLQVDVEDGCVGYEGSEVLAPFMPKALVIPGALHICSNLCKDVARKLDHWNDFVNELSSLEALLCNRDRRERFVATCVPKDSEQRALFKNFSGSLYEKRWGAITSFLRKLMPLLEPLRLFWDEGKYLEGYNQRESAEDQDAGEGAAFLPAAITACVQSNFFLVYTSMIMSVLGLVEDLTGWFETCPCHKETLDPTDRSRLSRAVQRELRACGTDRSCPMKGKRAPQLAAGALDEVFQEILTICRGSVLKIVRANPIAQDQEGLLWRDFESARSYVQMGLQAKFDFWEKLPWQLAGLCHPSVEKAREVAKTILEKVDGLNVENPGVVHHPLTLKFLSPDGNLRPMIQSFADGHPMSSALNTEACMLAFAPVVERSIEAKHSLITRRAQKHWRSGRVVSLTLRVPDIKEQIKVDATFFDDLVKAFALVRDPRKAAHQLGLQNHPALLDASFGRVRKNTVVGILDKIVYRADAESKFRRPTQARKEHDAHVSKRARLADRQIQSMLEGGGDEPQPRRVVDGSFDSALRVAVADHFRVVSSSHGSGAMYTLSMVPSSTGALPMLTSLESVLNTRPQESRSANVPNSAPTLASDVDAESNPGAEDIHASVHFQVLHTAPSRLKTVPLAAAAGKRLQKGDIVISLHAALPSGEDQTLVSLEPIVRGKTAVVVLSNLAAGDLESLQSSFTQRSLEDLLYSIKGFRPQGCSSCVSEITRLVHAGAFPDSCKMVEVPLQEGRAPVAWEELETAGLVTSSVASPDLKHYVLSDVGAQSLEAASTLGQPKLVCEPREAMPLADCTVYELVRKLMDSGWEWANLPASRTQRLALQYKPGERKTWYCPAGSLPHKAYLTCLLECERLGLEIVPHWSPSPAACYGRLLDGKGPAVRQARPRLMLMNDVDDDCAQGDGAGVVPDAEASPMIGDEVAQQNISEGSEDDSLMRELERLLEDDDEQPSAPAPGAASSGSQPELSESLPGVSVAAGAALDLPHEPEAEAHVAQPSRVERGARLQPVVPGQIQHWGVFRISSLKPKAPTRPFGALEALCPFHKRSVKSECKKYIAHKSSSPEDHALDLKALKHWCSQAKNCAFAKRSHSYEAS